MANPSSSTSENQSNNKRPPHFFASPFVLFRVCSLLFVFLLAGHWSSYPWSSASNLQESHLTGSMKSIDFVFMGEHQTYWGLYFGWGLLVGVLLFAMVVLLWILSDLTRLAPRRLGVIAGIISAISMAGAYISFRFFYVPPFVCYSAICVIMLTATVQLLRQTPSKMQNSLVK